MADALSDLLAELEQTDDDVAIEIAAATLAEAETSREHLTRLSKHRTPSVRRAVALALGRRSDPEARSLLEERLKDANGGVRRAACRGLAALADVRSLPVLLPLLNDALAGVRACAAEALRAYAEPRVVQALERLLKNDSGLAPRTAAIGTLAAIAKCSEELRDDALTAIACHIPREEDLELSDLATNHLVEVAGGLTHEQLLVPARKVPRSGRAALADALLQSPTALSPGLARIADELRHIAPDKKILDRFGSDLTQRAERGDLTRAHGRDAELKAILEHLGRGVGPRCVLLVGPSGVGKTALIHELAIRLASEPVLVRTVLHEATTGEILSGTRYLGEWQTRLKELQNALESPRRAVWYVPDVNRLVDAGTSEHSQESFATMLAPTLDRGELAIIGESTPEAYRRGLDRHPGISKLFWKLDVHATSPAETREILSRVADDLTQKHAEHDIELVIPKAAIDLAQELADDHLPSSLARPGNAVKLLREAVTVTVQAQSSARESGVGAVDATARVDIRPRQILKTLSQLTGVPIRLLDDTVPLDLLKTRRFFAERVLGQDEAVETVVDLISLVKTGLTDPTRPTGVLFFVGPTGVGKTEMAKALAEFIFGSADRLVRIDLGEFREPGSHRRLVGDPHAPEPAARSGLLTAPVRERPFSVVLFDEVEKAHPNVFHLLLPLMDEGRLIDEQGRVTDFRRAIVVMTSNLGADLREDVGLGFLTDASDPDNARSGKIQRMMEETFQPEFLNRLTKTVVFAPLSLEVMRRLTRREMRRVLARRGIARRNVIVEADDAVIGILLQEGFSDRFGARPLKRRVEELLLKPLARAILRLAPPTAGEEETEEGQAIIRLGVQDERLISEIVFQRQPEQEEEEAPAARSATARIRDPRRGRLVSVDDLEQRALELSEKVDGITEFHEHEHLRERKRELLEKAQTPDLWNNDREQASAIFSEIANLERTLETPGHLQRRIERLDGLLTRARQQPGETRILHDLLARIGELAHDIEFATYATRCPTPEDRGDAYLHLHRVDDGGFPEDVIAKMAAMYRSYLKDKRLGFRVIYERVPRKGIVREAGLRVEGMCAFGLLKGESGLHQWIHRTSEPKRTKKTAFVRVSVFPPATAALRPGEVKRERRPTKDEPGVLLKKHRQHLVLTHMGRRGTLLALDGSVSGRPEAEQDAMAFLAARVARARRSSDKDAGVVRRYVISNQPVVRDLTTGIKTHLDPVLDGKLDEFVLPRILGDSG